MEVNGTLYDIRGMRDKRPELYALTPTAHPTVLPALCATTISMIL